ncbi:membrane protein [Streptomyces longisporoflavus]|uniref:hypothetical protein n=1 Tax=Streptomyces longisporoflavus TaxID=28044 RepID=UPI00167E4839|nr:hypothetical protein [Streptomyces longisporoflavus]GGV65331.1 membrane protein [Streptomyces longisporoflavus]
MTRPDSTPGPRPSPRPSSRTRDAFALVAFVLALLALAAGFLWTKGAWRAVIRESPNLIADWPGGAWLFGIMAGVLAVAGAYGGLWAADALRGDETPGRVARRAAKGVCWAVPVIVTAYIISALPGRNCSSSSPTCRQVDGAFPALLAYAVTAAALAWAAYRVHSTREEQRRAAHRTRLRRLRKKGKGKSREAR